MRRRSFNLVHKRVRLVNGVKVATPITHQLLWTLHGHVKRGSTDRTNAMVPLLVKRFQCPLVDLGKDGHNIVGNGVTMSLGGMNHFGGPSQSSMNIVSGLKGKFGSHGITVWTVHGHLSTGCRCPWMGRQEFECFDGSEVGLWLGRWRRLRMSMEVKAHFIGKTEV